MDSTQAFNHARYNAAEELAIAIRKKTGFYVSVSRDERTGISTLQTSIAVNVRLADDLLTAGKSDLPAAIAEKLMDILVREVNAKYATFRMEHIVAGLPSYAPPRPGSEKSREYGLDHRRLPPGMDMEHKSGYATGGIVGKPSWMTAMLDMVPPARLPSPLDAVRGENLREIMRRDESGAVYRSLLHEAKKEVPMPSFTYSKFAEVFDQLASKTGYFYEKEPTAPAPAKSSETISREQFWRNAGFAGEPPERIK